MGREHGKWRGKSRRLVEFVGSWVNKVYHSPQLLLASLFDSLGRTIARSPWLFILIPTLVSLCLTLGSLWIELETLDDVWDLYFPRNKPIASSAEKLRNTFIPSPSLNRTFCPFQTFGSSVSLPVLAVMPCFGTERVKHFNSTENSSAIVWEKEDINYGFEALKSLCNFVENFTLQISPSGHMRCFEDVCAYSVGDSCLQPIVCTALKNSQDKNSITIEPPFQPVVLPRGAKVDPLTHQVLETPALRLVWHFKTRHSSQVTYRAVIGSDSDPSAIFIRTLFDELYRVRNELGKGDHVTFVPYSHIVQSDEVHSIVKNDSKLMAITVVLMTVFSVLVSVNKRQGILRSRALMAVAGVLTTCMAIGSAVGLLALLGVKFIQCAFLAPFIMLGIGIDSTFVITFTWAKEFSKWTKLLPIEHNRPKGVNQVVLSSSSICEREQVIGNTMKSSFIAVFISDTTALLAFLVGSFTPYQAVNITCYYLAAITFFLLLLQSTFLIGCLSFYHELASSANQPATSSLPKVNGVHEQNGHQMTSKADSGFSKNQRNPSRANGFVSSVPKHAINFTNQGIEMQESNDSVVFNTLERFISDNLHKVVLNNYVRVSAIFLVGAAITISVGRVYNMKQYINEMGFQPDNSRVMEFYATSRVFYPADPMMMHFVIDEPLFYNGTHTRLLLDNFYSRLTQNRMALKSNSSLMQKPWFQKIPNQNYNDMRDYVNELKLRFGIEKHDLSSFEVYMSGLMNRCHQNDVLISEDEMGIEKSRFVIPFQKIESSSFDQGFSLVEELQKIIDSVPFKVYFASSEMMLIERNSLMKESIWHSVLVAILCCSAIAWLLLPTPTLFLTVIATLTLAMATTMGFMALLGMHYNIATYIIVLLLIGLCIDYISHSGHAYLCASQQLSRLDQEDISHLLGSKSNRELSDDVIREQTSRLALRNIGVPLTNAALSSLLSVSMLGFGSSYVMRDMFKSMMLLFSLSFFYGIVFLPIVLSFFGPVASQSQETEKSSSDKCQSELSTAKKDLRTLSSKNNCEITCGCQPPETNQTLEEICLNESQT